VGPVWVHLPLSSVCDVGVMRSSTEAELLLYSTNSFTLHLVMFKSLNGACATLKAFHVYFLFMKRNLVITKPLNNGRFAANMHLYSLKDSCKQPNDYY